MKPLIKSLSPPAIGRIFAGTAPAGPGDAYLVFPTAQRRERNRIRNHRFVWGLQMTTIVGIFDNARDLDKAVQGLARAGFEDTVYDEAIVGRDAVNVGPPVFAPGSAPAVVWGSAEPDWRPKPD